MDVRVEWTGGMAFAGRGESGHEVIMDAGPGAGGLDTGARPTELLLMAVGGCTGIDVVSILTKMNMPPDGLAIEVYGTRAEEHPRYFTNVEIVYRVHGEGLDRDKVERAVRLSVDKYCSVSQTLLGRAAVTHRVEIQPPSR